MAVSWQSVANAISEKTGKKCVIVQESEYQIDLRCEWDKCYVEASQHSQFCDEIVQRILSSATCSQWIVKETFPRPSRHLYRKKYSCHFASKNKVKGSKHLRSKDHDCKAEVDIKVKKNTVDTRKKDRLLADGLQTCIQIYWKHSHNSHTAETYSYLHMDSNTETTFVEYFKAGLTPAAAKNFHEMKLSSNCDEMALPEVLANGQINPTARQIYYLYDVWRKANFGGRDADSTKKVLSEKIEEFSKCGTEIVTKENPFTVAIVTPIMARANKEKFARSIIFVDSTGSCDQTNTCVTFIFARSKSGGIPLGCVFHVGQTEHHYYEAFSALKEAIANCNSHIQPDVIMTDDSTPERAALRRVFPTSVLLLCTFHVCQFVWRWLWDSKQRIEKNDRQHLMRLFRNALYAPQDEECQCEWELLLSDKVAKKYSNFLKYMEGLWMRRSEWALCLRRFLNTKGNNTNNIVEASIRIFKDLILQRCKAFNVCALLDFVVVVLEQYHKRRLLDYANCRRNGSKILHNKLMQKAETLKVVHVCGSEYQVTRQDDDHLVYTVHCDLELCDCFVSHGGAFCKHMAAVQAQYNAVFTSCPQLTAEDRLVLVRLALGTNFVNADFYLGIQDVKQNAAQSDVNSSCRRLEAGAETRCVTDCTRLNPTNPDVDVPLTDLSNVASALLEVPNHYIASVMTMQNHLARLCETAKGVYSEDLAKRIQQINKHLERVQTPSQLTSLLVLCSQTFSSRKIKVQPGAISRRLKRDGLTTGAKRMQAGRPSQEENKLRKKGLKRKRNIAQNIERNLANAKTH